MAGQTDDRDDIFDDEDEDETAAVIRKALDEQGFNDEAEEDDGGFDAEPTDEDKTETVSQEEATKLASDAQVKGGKARKPKKAEAAETTEGDEGAEAESAEGDDKPEAKGADKAEDDPKPEAEPEDLTALSTDDLMKGVPHKSRAEITRRLDAATKALAPFKNPYIKSQMQRFGVDEVAVATRLADLARYATEKPDEYIAWVASEMAGSPDKIVDVLNAAAERHGLKVVAAEGEPDPFEDEEVARLRRENEALKRQTAPRDFGPDTPERQRARQIEQDLNNWMYERDEAGNLRRPHFQMLEPHIQRLAAAHVQQTRQPVTMADLDRFYQTAEAQVRGTFAPAQTYGQPAAPQPTNLAARETPPVDDGLQRRHEAAQRAQRAAKSIDGTGQSATRRPALDADADLSDVIRAQLQRYSA